MQASSLSIQNIEEVRNNQDRGTNSANEECYCLSFPESMYSSPCGHICVSVIGLMPTVHSREPGTNSAGRIPGTVNLCKSRTLYSIIISDQLPLSDGGHGKIVENPIVTFILCHQMDPLIFGNDIQDTGVIDKAFCTSSDGGAGKETVGRKENLYPEQLSIAMRINHPSLQGG